MNNRFIIITVLHDALTKLVAHVQLFVIHTQLSAIKQPPSKDMNNHQVRKCLQVSVVMCKKTKEVSKPLPFVTPAPVHSSRFGH